MAIRKPNRSLRPVAVGETPRRLSKVAVELKGSSIQSILELFRLGFRRGLDASLLCTGCLETLPLDDSLGWYVLPS